MSENFSIKKYVSSTDLYVCLQGHIIHQAFTIDCNLEIYLLSMPCMAWTLIPCSGSPRRFLLLVLFLLPPPHPNFSYFPQIQASEVQPLSLSFLGPEYTSWQEQYIMRANNHCIQNLYSIPNNNCRFRPFHPEIPRRMLSAVGSFTSVLNSSYTFRRSTFDKTPSGL